MFPWHLTAASLDTNFCFQGLPGRQARRPAAFSTCPVFHCLTSDVSMSNNPCSLTRWHGMACFSCVPTFKGKSASEFSSLKKGACIGVHLSFICEFLPALPCFEVLILYVKPCLQSVCDSVRSMQSCSNCASVMISAVICDSRGVQWLL